MRSSLARRLDRQVRKASSKLERSKRSRVKPTQRGAIVVSTSLSTDAQRNAERAARFSRAVAPRSSPPPSKKRRRQAARDAKAEGASADRIVGTCSVLEKGFFRITSAVDPATVRPIRVLRRALTWVHGLWSAESDAVAEDDSPPSVESEAYQRVCEQLKSIRQDCTLQGLEGDFAIVVYETHARIALEAGDFDEFNRCQTKLSQLHCAWEDRAGGGGGERGLHPHRGEFLGYRVLYELVLSRTVGRGCHASLTTLLQSLPAQERCLPGVERAMRVVRACLSSRYARFHALRAEIDASGDMEGYLIERLVPPMRAAAFGAALAAYRPAVPCKAMQRILGFKQLARSSSARERKREAKACREWLRKRDAVLKKSTAGERAGGRGGGGGVSAATPSLKVR